MIYRPVLPTKWEVKAYLIEKFDPGIFAGMPKVVSYKEIEKTISQNQDLARFLHRYFDIKDDNELYRRIMQMKNIELHGIDGVYSFTLTDGRGHEVTTYRGFVRFEKNKISDIVTGKETKQVPC